MTGISAVWCSTQAQTPLPSTRPSGTWRTAICQSRSCGRRASNCISALRPFPASESVRRTNLLLGVVAAALILAAVMNYIMIVISSLIGRAKGIAVRRCYGAGGGTIMGIVFKETLINLAVSLVLAFLLILAFRNTVEEIMMTSLGALFSPHSLWVLALTVVVVLLIAAYP